MVGQSDLTSCKKIIVSNHALDSWNRRVGPKIPRRKMLEQQMNIYIKRKDRIKVKKYGCLVFDDEIVAGVRAENGILVISTFFGRISENPLLMNIEALLSFFYTKRVRGVGRRKVIVKDGIHLDLPTEVLARQELPFPKHKSARNIIDGDTAILL